jgi:hypothetical protein
MQLNNSIHEYPKIKDVEEKRRYLEAYQRPSIVNSTRKGRYGPSNISGHFKVIPHPG